jgi:hypothetical protein
MVHSAEDGSIPVEFEDGAVLTVTYPFVRETYTTYDDEGGCSMPTWRPGVRYEDCGPEDVEPVADAEGQAIFTVVATFKPGRFPTRVFFTRRFVSPEGKVFGKGKLHIATAEKVRRLARGYRDPYRLSDTANPIPHRYEAAGEVSPNLKAKAQGDGG